MPLRRVPASLMFAALLAGCGIAFDPNANEGVVDAPLDEDPLLDPFPSDCVRGALVDTLARCIDGGTGPRTCLADALATLEEERPLCDIDGDGLPDDFEDALAHSYAMAFAFNGGDGTHTGGNPETAWPDNIAHYVGNSSLIWREGNNLRTLREVLARPTLATLGTASIEVGGRVRYAADSGDGSNFWLCLRQSGGRYPASSLVRSMNASRTLPGGIDVATVVHPADGDPEGRYVFVANFLYYAFNEHAGVNNHEGDWEGGGVVVDLETGQVMAAYFDRHGSVDDRLLLPLTGPDAVPAIDPARERTFGNVCSERDAARAWGVRFWDYAGPRHHVVLYVSTGGHSSYGYPGNTKLFGVGCLEPLIQRDTHNGDGYKLLPWLGTFVPGWSTAGAQPVLDGVHLRNVGEEQRPRLPWSAFRGQWGCQHDMIARSYPGPWGNDRHCRAWMNHRWGTLPPFSAPDRSASCK